MLESSWQARGQDPYPGPPCCPAHRPPRLDPQTQPICSQENDPTARGLVGASQAQPPSCCPC